VRDRILSLVRTTYAGFNDHHLCQKLTEQEGFSLSRETLRRLLRSCGLGPPHKRRPPAHRQRRMRSAREGEIILLDGSPHDWLEGRGPRLTALGFQDDATGKILQGEFFLTETTEGYFHLLRRLLRDCGVPVAFYGDRNGIFVRNDDHWTIQEELVGQREPTQFGRALQQLGITYIAAHSPQAKGRVERLWGVLQDRLVSELRLAGAPGISIPPTTSCGALSPTTTAASLGLRAQAKQLGAPLPKTWTASAASCIRASSATITSCSGTDSASKSLPILGASVSLVPRSSSTRIWKVRSRSITGTRG
jgi:hypothetical protein